MGRDSRASRRLPQAWAGKQPHNSLLRRAVLCCVLYTSMRADGKARKGEAQAPGRPCRHDTRTPQNICSRPVVALRCKRGPACLHGDDDVPSRKHRRYCSCRSWRASARRLHAAAPLPYAQRGRLAKRKILYAKRTTRVMPAVHLSRWGLWPWPPCVNKWRVFPNCCIGQRHVAHELERVGLTSIRKAHTRRVQQSLRLACRRAGSCATCLCPIQCFLTVAKMV